MCKLNQPKKTGEVMFQFDNEEPIKICDIFDYSKFIIELQQQKKLDKGFVQNNNPVKIEFTSEMKERFKLYIEDCL